MEYSTLTVAQLTALAAESGVELPPKAKKPTIIELLGAAAGGDAPPPDQAEVDSGEKDQAELGAVLRVVESQPAASPQPLNDPRPSYRALAAIHFTGGGGVVRIRTGTVFSTDEIPFDPKTMERLD